MLAILTSAAAVLLAVAGVAKLRSPSTAAAMLAELAHRPALRRSPALPAAVRLAGAGEAVVGVLVLAVGGRWPTALLAGWYAAFAVLSLRAVATSRRNTATPRASCGCFGRADTPLGLAHLLLTAVCLGLGCAAAIHPFGAAAGLADAGAAAAVTGLLQIGLLAGLGYLTITSLPALAAARRLEEAS